MYLDFPEHCHQLHYHVIFFFIFVLILICMSLLTIVVINVANTIYFSLIFHTCFIIRRYFYQCYFTSWFCTPRKYLSISVRSYIHQPISLKNDNRSIMAIQSGKKSMHPIILNSKTNSQIWDTKILDHIYLDFWKEMNNLVTIRSQITQSLKL